MTAMRLSLLVVRARLGALLLRRAVGCGLISSDITKVTFDLPAKTYSFDSAQWGIPGGSAVAVHCGVPGRRRDHHRHGLLQPAGAAPEAGLHGAPARVRGERLHAEAAGHGRADDEPQDGGPGALEHQQPVARRHLAVEPALRSP